MIEVNFNVNSMQIWTGELIAKDRIEEVNRLCSKKFIHTLKHPKFILPQSILGERGFKPLVSIEEQAFCQVLAHAGCIPSCLLFGLSLSNAPPLTSRVYCDINAYEYMYLGLEAMLYQHQNEGFVDEANFLASTRTLYEICQHVIEQSKSLGFKHEDTDVIKFAKVCLVGIKTNIQLDS